MVSAQFLSRHFHDLYYASFHRLSHTSDWGPGQLLRYFLFYFFSKKLFFWYPFPLPHGPTLFLGVNLFTFKPFSFFFIFFFRSLLRVWTASRWIPNRDSSVQNLIFFAQNYPSCSQIHLAWNEMESMLQDQIRFFRGTVYLPVWNLHVLFTTVP